MQTEANLNAMNSGVGAGSIFNIGHHSSSSTSIYNYSNGTPPSQTQPQLNNSQSTVNNSNLANSYVEIQAQFELSVELRKFINIDLFQRGYYQVRLSIKCGNKQIPVKIIVQLENAAQTNNNLSDLTFPSCVIDDYAVSKTFLILYKNEEVILDDHILFKISVLLNAFNIQESFEKLDLQLNVELWFTENEYRPNASLNSLGSSQPGSPNPSSSNTSQQQSPANFASMLMSMTAANNAAAANQGSEGALNNAASFTNLQQPQQQAASGSVLQQLCVRTFKVKFDPRRGIHLQIPVLFDYFHLSAVMMTLHCTLLTLLPPVMLGNSFQRNLTLSSILFGKDISQFKNTSEIGAGLMSRAVYLHNQICSLLLTSYENLQDHISKMSQYLSEFQKKELKLEYVDCKEKLRKITEIIQNCTDAEALDDLANTHVAQCSAENIMQWCLYLDTFSLNDSISPLLATEYHTKRLKRFSESFFTKDVPRVQVQDYESSDNYVLLYDMIRQSAYFQQMPDMIVCCDDLDGLPDNMPIIFEENYVPTVHPSQSQPQLVQHHRQLSSAAAASASKKVGSPRSGNFIMSILNSSNTTTNTSSSLTNSQQSGDNWTSAKKKAQQSSSRKSSQSSSAETSSASSVVSNNASNDFLSTSQTKKLHKKMKKKLMNSGDSFVENYGSSKKSITLVSYRKTDDYFNSDRVIINTNGTNTNINTTTSSSASSTTMGSTDGGGGVGLTTPTEGASSSSSSNAQIDNQTRLSMIKADLLASKMSTPVRQTSTQSTTASATPSTASSRRNSAIKGDIGAKIANAITNASASDLLFGGDRHASSDENSAAKRVNELSDYLKQADISVGSMDESKGGRTATCADDSIVSAEDRSSLDDSVSSEITTSRSTTTATAASVSRLRKSNATTGATSGDVPPDCSVKSRMLYESFRGKNATLERPKRQVRRSLLNSNSSYEESPNLPAASHRKTSLTDAQKAATPVRPPLPLELNADETKIANILFANTAALKNNSASVPYNLKTVDEHKDSKSVVVKKQLAVNSDRNSLSFVLNENVYKFVVAKEELKRALSNKYQGNIYSEFQSFFCTAPYFYSELTPKLSPSSSFSTELSVRSSTYNNNQSRSSVSSGGSSEDLSTTSERQRRPNEAAERSIEEEKVHLVVCVHGLEGNSGDLRLIRTYLELALPGARLDFLMSEQNQESTFDDIEVMTEQLIQEIVDHIDAYGLEPDRISFIGHSLGNLIIRSAVAHANFKPYVSKLHTYLSLSGPHLGTLYNPSGLVNMGLWIMQKWKKSGSLLQLSLKDNTDPHKTFLFKLSKKPTFEYFKNILLVASPQDRYVPFHSARIEMCKGAVKDSAAFGNLYREMVWNILKPIHEHPNIVFKRYTSFHNLPSGTSNFIGRAAHIAVLDSELFVEKLILVSVAKYFR